MSTEFTELLNEAQEVTAPSQDSLAVLSQLGAKLKKLKADKEELERQAAEIKKSISEIEEREIPVLFDQLRIKELTLLDGSKLSLKPIYIGKIPEDKKEQAFEWLENHGYGTIVKTSVEARFGMGEFEKAKELAAKLEAEHYTVSADRSVHPASLGKFVKVLTLEGKDIPQDLFNPQVLRRADIS